MMSTLDKSIEIKQYLRTLWRHKGIVLLATICVLCAALIALSFMPRQYQSEVTLMIEERQPLANDLEAILGRTRTTGSRYGVDEERLGKLVGRIRSRPFLERVIRLLKINEDPTIRAEAEARHRAHPEAATADEIAIRLLVQRLQSRIEFRSVGPGIYRIIVADFSPMNAQVLAKWISELFVDISIQNELQQIRTARDFGAEQLRVYEDQLRRSEEALQHYKGSMIQQDLASNMVQAENLTLAIALLERIRDEAETARARVQPFRREATRAGIEIEGPSAWEDADTRDLIRRVTAALRGAVNDRLAVTAVGEIGPWPPQGSYASQRRDLLQHIEASIATRYPDTGTEARTAAARYEFARIDAEIQVEMVRQLEQAIQGFRAQAEAQPGDEAHVARLQNEVQKNRQLLESFRSQMVAGDVSQAVETTKLGMRIEILDPAQLPLAPSRPDRNKILLAALLMGPLMGAGFAFLGDTMDVTLRSLDDFRRLAPEPILCTTPLMRTLTARPRGLRRYWIPASVAVVVLLTAGFFVARETVLQRVVTKGKPVRMVDPKNVVQP